MSMEEMKSIANEVIENIKCTFPFITFTGDKIIKKAKDSVKKSSVDLLEKLKNKFKKNQVFSNVVNAIDDDPDDVENIEKLKEIIISALENDEIFRNEILTYIKKDSNKKVISNVNGNNNLTFTAGNDISNVSVDRKE